MIPLNYHHLYYFWRVARCGSISAAKDALLLSQPTLSGQLQELERSCKARLLTRGRKGVALTPEGRAVFGYCERIFGPGDELAAMLEKGFEGPVSLRIGVQTTIPKEITIRMLDFARSLERRVRIAVFNGETDDLSARLQRQTLDFAVLSEDASARLGREYRSRLVCSLPVEFVASPSQSRALKGGFPSRHSAVPMLLRPEDNPVRKQVDLYLAKRGVRAEVEAELEDADVIRRLAVRGFGVAAMNALASGPDIRARRLIRLRTGPTGIAERVWFLCGRHPRSNPALRRITEALWEKFHVQA